MQTLDCKKQNGVGERRLRLLPMSGILTLPFKVMLFISAMMLYSCSGNDEQESAYLSIDSTPIEVGFEGGRAYRTISSNTKWRVDNYAGWVHVSTKEGKGSKELVIDIDANPSKAPRSTEVYVVSVGAADRRATLRISQESGSGTSSIAAPQNLKVTVNGKMVSLTWDAVSGATKYYVYRNTGSGDYDLISTVSKNSAVDSNPAEKNYYKVKAANNTSTSDFSAYAYVSVSGGGSSGGDNPKKPAAPTGVRVSNEGNNLYPMVVVRWNEVSGASKYYVYKASYASGSYSQLGTAQYNVFTDPTPPTNGKSAYYKVKAVNDAGLSDFSDYAVYTAVSNDEAFSPGYRYGNCTASGSTITLRWENLTGSGYGKATKIVLRVWNPYAEEWQDTELSANATSASFNYTNKVDDDGWVKCGIVVSNSKGSFTAGAKVYNAKTKTWIN